MHNLLETLEDRIAPAGLFTYHDVDGDVVKVTSSKGSNADLRNAVAGHLLASGSGYELDEFDLTNPHFQGTDFTVAVMTKGAHGNGHVNVGFIDATGVDLGAVRVKGDLGRINAGDANTHTTAIRSLIVDSFGAQGRGQSDINGGLHSVHVLGNMRDANVNVHGNVDPDAKIGTFVIDGSLIGGSTLGAGGLTVAGNIGLLKIGGDLRGGSGMGTGQISTTGAIHQIAIHGSLVGGMGASSGVIACINLDILQIGGDVVGNGGTQTYATGYVQVQVNLNHLTIGGSIIGGSGTDASGFIIADHIGSATVHRNITGGRGHESAVITASVIDKIVVGGKISGGEGVFSGVVDAFNIGSAKVGGDVTGGDGDSSGSIDAITKGTSISIGGKLSGGTGDNSGEIHSDGKLKVVHVAHSVVGGRGINSGQISSGEDLGVASVGGSLHGGAGDDSGSIFVGGDAQRISVRSSIIAGSGDDSGFIHITGTLGSVSVGGTTRPGGIVHG